MGKIIAVVGSTGVGKTAFVKALAARGNFNLALEEHEERPYQLKFAKNTKYAFHNQIDYLLLRAEQEITLRNEPRIGLIDGGLDLDFHGFNRLFFVRGYLTENEFLLGQRLYKIIRAGFPYPELIIHLNAPIEVIRKRLAGRKRINIANAEDVELLESFLCEWLDKMPSEQVIHIDVTHNDPEYKQILAEFLPVIRERLN